jgi:hypothetical protein
VRADPSDRSPDHIAAAGPCLARRLACPMSSPLPESPR